MARPLRIQFPDACYHVISRGNERKPIVRDDADREKRLDWLRRTVETYGWLLHSYVLMTNHEHLFVQTPGANLAAGMQYYNGSYTGYFNRRHRRVGHLFQGRHKGHLIEENGYFLEVSRYVHLNPVRAELVESPEQYAWSSYLGFIHKRKRVPWMCYRKVPGEFEGITTNAQAAYRRFVLAGLNDSCGSPFSHAINGLIVGSEDFAARIKRRLEGVPEDRETPELRRLRSRPSISDIVQAVAKHFGYKSDASFWTVGTRSDDAARASAAYLARVRFGYSATSVAKALSYRDSSGVSHAVKRIRNTSKEIQAAIREIEESLT